MSMNQPDIEHIQRAVATSLHEHWVLFLVEGIILDRPETGRALSQRPKRKPEREAARRPQQDDVVR